MWASRLYFVVKQPRPSDAEKPEWALSWSIKPQALASPTQPNVSLCPDLAGFASN